MAPAHLNFMRDSVDRSTEYGCPFAASRSNRMFSVKYCNEWGSSIDSSIASERMSDVIIVAVTNDNTLGIEASSPPSPRVIGWIWVGYFLIGVLGTLLTKGIVVPTDAVSTSSNILAHASLYRAGFAVDFVSNLIYIALTALVFQLFRPVNPTLALLAAFFSLVGCTVQIMGELLRLAPTVVLANPQLASAFGVQQLQAAALLSVTLYKSIFYIAFVLFACFELVTGFLILRSTYLPRWIG